MNQIRRLLALDWEIKMGCMYREANRCADALANMGCHQEDGLIYYEHCPAQVSSLLLPDNMLHTYNFKVSLCQ
jgi:hypothetical protein